MLKRLRAKSRKNQKGFTLIELLAVIVILAILAAIAIPSVVSIISKQNNKAAAQNALNAIHAARLYVADHNTTSGLTLTTSQNPGASETSMASYVDKVGGISGDYSVTVTINNGSATYSIASGPLPSDVPATKTESDLIQYNKGN